MKATIDGIILEGTPEEICEFKQLYDEKRLKEKAKPFMNPPINPFRSGSVDAVGKGYVSTGGKNPYTVTFDKATEDAHSWHGIDTVNPNMKCETENK